MPDPQTSYQISESVVGWVIGLMGSVVMFFLGLGIKDWREKVKKIDTLCLQLSETKGSVSRELAELRGDVRRVEQMVADLRSFRADER